MHGLFQRAAVVAALAALGWLVYSNAGEGWRDRLTDRLVYGVPWGSMITILLVVSVYLFVQSGLRHPSDPVVAPFRSWSYLYPTGLLAAGFTHAGPGHLLGNLVGAAVFTPLVEFAWGHYPDRDEGGSERDGHPYPPPGGPTTDGSVEGESTRAGGLRSRPLVRAFVLFPLGIVAVSLVTSVFSGGWSLGYSGTVFFLFGFAAVKLPRATVVGMVAMSGLGVLLSAIQTPVVTVTATASPPSPPGWAGINVGVHLFGALLGVLVAFWYARRRANWPRVGWFALAVLSVVLLRGLWSVWESSGSTYTRYQAVGVAFVLVLTGVLVAVVAVEDVTVAGSFGLRQLLVGGVLALAVALAVSTVPVNLVGMDEDPVPDGETIEIRDYSVTYAEDVSHGRVDVDTSGVIVVSEQRQLWSSRVGVDELAFDGEASVTVGGVGWRETVDVERTGWNVAGNDTVYSVALEGPDERIEPFRSAPKRATGRLDGLAVAVVAEPDEFRVQLRHEGESVGSTAIPEGNGTTTATLEASAPVETVTVETEVRDGERRLLAEHDGSRLLVATEENDDA